MKKYIFLVLLLSLGVSYAQQAPFDGRYVASRLIAGGGTPLKGHAYLLGDGPYMKVIQNLNDGLLVQLNTGLFGNSPVLKVKTARRQADESYLPIPSCGVYNGIFSYTNTLGSTSTVHSFSEVSCKPYLPIMRKISEENTKRVEALNKKYDEEKRIRLQKEQEEHRRQAAGAVSPDQHYAATHPDSVEALKIKNLPAWEEMQRKQAERLDQMALDSQRQYVLQQEQQRQAAEAARRSANYYHTMGAVQQGVSLFQQFIPLVRR